ncbi:MAG: AAA family ATPase [Ktedonobacteraceae bacterium]
MLAPFVDPAFHQEQPLPLLPLVGRTMEMQVIHTLLATVSNDLPVGARSLTLSGEMGIGKTRLLAEACHEARARGFDVLEMRAYESSLTFPYFLFVEALRPVLRAATLDQLRSYVGLPGAISSSVEEHPTAENISLTGTPLVTSLTRLFPELPALVQIRPQEELLSPDQEKFRLFDAIATLFERLAATRPLLICIDSLQWADSASLEMILYLTIRLRASRVALIGATRPAQGGQEQNEQDEVTMKRAAETVTRVLMELMQQGMWLPLPLGPLDAETMTTHIHALLPGILSENVLQLLLAHSEGNPFFLEELVRTLTLHGQLLLREDIWEIKQPSSIKLPASIVSAVQRRLENISPACLELLSQASLFGRAFPIDALAQVVEHSEGNAKHPGTTIQALLDEAIQASLIARVPENEPEDRLDLPDTGFHITLTQYIFCQGIVQEILHATIPTQQMRHLHGAIGQALERCYDYEAPKHAAELAAHYAASSERVAALRWSLLAGEDATRQQAHRRAISHFRLSLQLLEEGIPLPLAGTSTPTPVQLHLTIGELWFQLGELEQATVSFQAALEQLHRQKSASPLLHARINRALADAYRMQARYELALAHLQAASAAFIEEEWAVGGQEQEQSISWFLERGTSAIAVMTIEHAYSAEHVLFLQAWATLDLLLNHPEEAKERLWQAHQLATALGDRSSQAFALHLIGWIYGWGEHIRDAIRFQQQAHELYLSLGDPFRAALGEQGLGIIYQALGEMETAHSYTQRGFELARRYGVRRVMGWLYWNQGMMALNQGDWASSNTHLQHALQEAQVEMNARLKPVVLLAQAVLQFRRGLWHEADPLFQEAIQSATNTDWFASTVAFYGHFLAVTGRRAAARTYLDRASALPELAGFSGSFYIPFLAEGYLHLDTLELATPYFERITHMRGFLYYGLAVDRVLGELATVTRNWDMAERAFEDGLRLCRQANNQPEEAAILYEQARMTVARGESVQHIRILCEQARLLFLQYHMQRSAALVETLLEGVQALEPVKVSEVHTAGHVLHLKLSAREREVLQLVAEGHTDREVADTLVLSPRTVNRHLSNIFVKLDVPGRAAAVAYAIRQGWV